MLPRNAARVMRARRLVPRRQRAPGRKWGYCLGRWTGTADCRRLARSTGGWTGSAWPRIVLLATGM
eukprot:1001345-Pyramimonas_sp.AAC.1